MTDVEADWLKIVENKALHEIISDYKKGKPEADFFQDLPPYLESYGYQVERHQGGWGLVLRKGDEEYVLQIERWQNL